VTIYYQSFPTPLGDFTVATNAGAALVATAFGDASALMLRRHASDLRPDVEHTAVARQQVEAYFAGARTSFDLPLAPEGSEFQQRVWRALLELPYGSTSTYGRMAADLASSPRAVGRANATNPICLIVPCHRLIGSDGSLTGFAYGLETKRLLLTHERNHAP
jgi:methylated-DNA-[protein]-cysteine S-methyltransferase